MKKVTLLYFLIALLLLASCSKDKDYFQNTGLQDPDYSGNILEYLQTRPEYFDSLIKVIELSGMDKIISEEEVTFFAPPKQSVMTAVTALNDYLWDRGQDTITDLNQVDGTVWRKTLSMYLIKGQYRLKDFPQIDTTNLLAYPGQGYVSYDELPMNVGVIYNDAGGVKYAGYRQICYSYLNNYGAAGGSMINAVVATSDIHPTNGILHVLRFYQHGFGFNLNRFILDATSRGIKY